jgi:hypothetical protein
MINIVEWLRNFAKGQEALGLYQSSHRLTEAADKLEAVESELLSLRAERDRLAGQIAHLI